MNGRMSFTDNQKGDPFVLRLKSHRFHTAEVAEALAKVIKNWEIPVLVEVEPGEENYWRSLGLPVCMGNQPMGRQLSCSFEVKNRELGGKILEPVRRISIGVLDQTREALLRGVIRPLQVEAVVEEPESGEKSQIVEMAAKAVRDADKTARDLLGAAVLKKAVESAEKKKAVAA